VIVTHDNGILALHHDGAVEVGRELRTNRHGGVGPALAHLGRRVQRGGKRLEIHVGRFQTQLSVDFRQQCELE